MAACQPLPNPLSSPSTLLERMLAFRGEGTAEGRRGRRRHAPQIGAVVKTNVAAFPSESVLDALLGRGGNQSPRRIAQEVSCGGSE